MVQSGGALTTDPRQESCRRHGLAAAKRRSCRANRPLRAAASASQRRSSRKTKNSRLARKASRRRQADAQGRGRRTAIFALGKHRGQDRSSRDRSHQTGAATPAADGGGATTAGAAGLIMLGLGVGTLCSSRTMPRRVATSAIEGRSACVFFSMSSIKSTKAVGVRATLF